MALPPCGRPENPLASSVSPDPSASELILLLMVSRFVGNYGPPDGPEPAVVFVLLPLSSLSCGCGDYHHTSPNNTFRSHRAPSRQALWMRIEPLTPAVQPPQLILESLCRTAGRVQHCFPPPEPAPQLAPDRLTPSLSLYSWTRGLCMPALRFEFYLPVTSKHKWHRLFWPPCPFQMSLPCFSPASHSSSVESGGRAPGVIPAMTAGMTLTICLVLPP